MSTRKRLLVAVAAVLVVGVGAWLIVRAASHREDSDNLTLYGNVDIRQVELGFRVSGRLGKLNFEEGQAVDAGVVLAELDSRPYQDALRSAEAQVAAQEATLSRLIKGPRKAEIDQARAAHANASAAAENARRNFARAEQLMPAGAITHQGHDDARAARDRSDARVAETREALRLLEQGTRQEDIAASEANLSGARARLDSAQTALDDTQLLAPSDGIILSRVKEAGAIVSPADVVYVLSLTRPVWVRAYVGEPQLGLLRPGQEVTITSDSAPDQPRSGRIGFISPTAEFTPKSVETPELRADLVYRFRVIVDDPGQSLRQGMPVTVHVPRAAAVAPAR